MKKLLPVLILFSFYFCTAQNYQCLKPGPKNFFLNGNGYLRMMRIDSVRASGGDTIYYPYHTPRGVYGCNYPPTPLDSNSGSWLGKKVIQQANGTFLFDNIWNDTVIIKTQAHLGDTWSFFNDTTHISYKATLTAIDTMTVLGSVDSVKKITIEADSGGIVNPLDPVNNFQIILSKNNGFVQVFDFYTFPYHRPDSIKTHRQFFDYYLDLVLGNLGTADITCFFDSTAAPDIMNSIFHLTSFHNPTMMELYDFAAGDVFESNDYYYNSAAGYSSEDILDSFLTRNVTPYSVTYMGVERTSTTDFTVSGITTNTTVTDNRVTFYRGYDTTLLFDFTRLPEEWESGSFYHYYPSASLGIGSCTTATYVMDNDNISYELNGGWVIFQPTDFNLMIGNYTVSYGIGYGMTNISTNNYQFDTRRTEHYTYVLKSGGACGIFTTVSVKDINAPITKIELFPNPATSSLTITASNKITKITITNLLGQTLYTHNYNTEQVQVDVANLPAGVYLIKINGTEVRKFMKE